MNNSTDYLDKLLPEVTKLNCETNDSSCKYLGLLMTIGILENTTVLYYFGCKAKKVSGSVFIMTLSLYDILLCSMSVPVETVDVTSYYTFTSGGVCKVFKICQSFCCGWKYIFVTSDFYRPLQKDMFPIQEAVRVTTSAYHMLVFNCILHYFFVWPALVFYNSETVEVKSEDGIPLQGYNCTTRRAIEIKLYLRILNGVYFLTFVIFTVLLVVMYILVWRVLIKHVKSVNLQKWKPLTETHSDKTGTSFSATESTRHTEAEHNHEHPLSVVHAHTTKTDALDTVTRKAKSHLDKKKNSSIYDNYIEGKYAETFYSLSFTKVLLQQLRFFFASGLHHSQLYGSYND